MNIVRTEYLISAGDFPDSPEWESFHWDIICGVEAISSAGPANHCEEVGLATLRRAFVGELASYGWEPALHLDNTPLKTCTPFDAGCSLEKRFVAAEFAPRNVQCAHAILCKMALGLVRGVLAAGVLVVTNDHRRLKPRIHTAAFGELTNYFDLWKALHVEDGLLMVVGVE
jgi:hypothetical protein